MENASLPGLMVPSGQFEKITSIPVEFRYAQKWAKEEAEMFGTEEKPLCPVVLSALTGDLEWKGNVYPHGLEITQNS
ncbi:hypothetical protein [Aestuariispira insulae]|uniref:Uncharacterized protein n=1 Tax=Aestuariispira insulae TaxID=1461337 RepID=A0A3D9H3Q1_9PROT|nr:hypothetical protein [Aestuariispira insulae]RED44109.1 hypothetical protein DFP90_11712 [Aestuariispira insulae]